MPVVVFSLGILLAAGAGGFFALRFSDRLHLVMGLSAGVLLGAVLFNLLPNSIALANEAHLPLQAAMPLVAAGFLSVHIVEKFLLAHPAGGEEVHGASGGFNVAGFFGHRLLDGLATGLAFAFSFQLGIVIGLSVLAHSFADGLNVVTLLMRSRTPRPAIVLWLLLTAAAPVVGVLASLVLAISTTVLAALLALFAGFFLYLGASDLLPEAHHRHPSLLTLMATVSGLLLSYALTTLLPEI